MGITPCEANDWLLIQLPVCRLFNRTAGIYCTESRTR